MGFYREDGSISSANDTIWGQRYKTSDSAVHKAVILKVVYTDDPENLTGSEVLYDVMIVGGPRNGQYFNNVSDVSGYGDRFNFSETIRKPTRIPLNVDISNPLNLKTVDQLNGSHVLVQFLNGDTLIPQIIGSTRHTQNKNNGTVKADGIQYQDYFNGIKTKIDKNGIYTWSKDKGMALPLFVDPTNPATILDPYIDEFAPIPGFNDIVKLTIDNDPKLQLKINSTAVTGISVTFNALSDSAEIKMGLGSSLKLDGLGDSLSYSTFTGIGLEVSGFSDSFSVSSLTGASLELKGFSDSFTINTAAGAALEVSGTSGISLKNALGDSLELANGSVELKNVTGANLSFDAAGFIKLGNSSGDALEIIGELIQSLSTAVYSGFGAPGSNAPELMQLLIKWKLITG